MEHLAARVLLDGLHLDCGKSLDPRTEVIGEHERSPTALNGA
jgi:hypothetical protein